MKVKKVYVSFDNVVHDTMDACRIHERKQREKNLKVAAQHKLYARMRGVLSKINTNNIVVDLVNSQEIAVELRDALNQVIQFQRRTVNTV